MEEIAVGHQFDPETSMKYEDFAGKVALITGATGGIGLCMAKTFLESGATVVLNGRSEEKLSALANELETTPGSVHIAVGDCTKYGDVQKVVEVAGKINGGIDLLVSAGAQGSVPPMPFADMTHDQLVSGFESRFFARVFPVHAAVPYLKTRGGSVVMLTTDAARYPTPGETIPGAVGAAVVLLTKALAKELSRSKIRVNSVALTLTSGTPSWDRIFSQENFQHKLFSKLMTKFPSGTAPTAEEVARVAVFLASEHAAQITGQTVSVNGGLSFGGW